MSAGLRGCCIHKFLLQVVAQNRVCIGIPSQSDTTYTYHVATNAYSSSMHTPPHRHKYDGNGVAACASSTKTLFWNGVDKIGCFYNFHGCHVGAGIWALNQRQTNIFMWLSLHCLCRVSCVCVFACQFETQRVCMCATLAEERTNKRFFSTAVSKGGWRRAEWVYEKKARFQTFNPYYNAVS